VGGSNGEIQKQERNPLEGHFTNRGLEDTGKKHGSTMDHRWKKSVQEVRYVVGIRKEEAIVKEMAGS